MRTGVDLRGLATSIKDQGRRGTCVACAATAAHELVRAEDLELSIEFIHWSSKRYDGLPPTSEGTTLPAAQNALAQDGQPPETTWPYDDTRDQWQASYHPPSAALAEANLRRVNGGGVLVPTAAAVRDALDLGQPVVLGVRLHATWFAVDANGRIAMPASGRRDLGGHAILVVGYRTDEFIIQNSWGSDWAEEGFAYLPSDYIDRFAMAAWSLAL